MSAEKSRFVWFDLMTTDAQAAKQFYSEIMGWTAQPWQGGGYDLWLAGDQPVGGMVELDAAERKAGTRPHWNGFVSTSDIEETTRMAKELGGKILSPIQDIPEVGKFASIEDPQGARFSVLQGRESAGAPTPDALGHYGWSELNTTDWKSAWKFYSALFGWVKTASMDMGEEFGEYFMFGVDSQRSLGGMSNAAKMMKEPAHWLHYANVRSVDESVKAIAAKGGKVLNGPMDVPGGDRIAQCKDPRGGYFAIFSRGKR